MITEFQDGFITKTKLNELVGGINALDSMTASETIYVGVGQTYATLSSALDYAKNKKPNRDYKIEIIIKSGTVVSEQLIYENADFGHVIISSEDVEVNVDVSGFTISKSSCLVEIINKNLFTELEGKFLFHKLFFRPYKFKEIL